MVAYVAQWTVELWSN